MKMTELGQKEDYMKKKRFCSLFSLILLLPCFSFGKEKVFEKAEDVTDCSMSSCGEEKKSILALKTTSGHSESRFAEIELELLDDGELVFAENGCKVVSDSRKDNNIKLLVEVESGEAILTVTAKTAKTSEQRSLYFYRERKGSVYYSDLSVDTAMKASRRDNNIPISEADYSLATSSLPPIIDIPLQRTKTISCSFSWRDTKGTKFPLVGASVEVKTSSGKINSKTTDSTGNAFFDFNSDSAFVNGGKEYLSAMWTEIQNDKYTISLSLEDDAICLIDHDNNAYSLIIKKSHITGNEAKTVNLCYAPTKNASTFTNDFGAARQIFQARYYYSSHAKKLAKINKIEKCKVVFPSNENQDQYSSRTNTIYISNLDSNNISRKAFESWDAFGHEYGHHLEKIFGLSYPQSGHHYFDTDDSYQLYIDSKDAQGKPTISIDDAKKRGLRLAWSEGWPTFWATIAQRSFPDDLKKEEYLGIGDDRYQASNFGFESGTNTTVYTLFNPKTQDGTDDYLSSITEGHSGDGCELSIIRFLYQLWDSDNSGSDIFTISEQNLWNSVVDLAADCIKTGKKESDKKIHYFYQVLTQFESDYGFDEIAKLAECYHLCPAPIYKGSSDSLCWSNYQSKNSNEDLCKVFYNRFIIGIITANNGITYLNEGKYIKPERKGDHFEYVLTNDDIKIIMKFGGNCTVMLSAFYVPTETSSNSVIGPVYSRKSSISLS